MKANFTIKKIEDEEIEERRKLETLIEKAKSYLRRCGQSLGLLAADGEAPVGAGGAAAEPAADVAGVVESESCGSAEAC